MSSRRLYPLCAMLISLTATAAQPQAIKADDLTISAPWAHATAAGITSSAVYFTIENAGKQLETLLRASSPAGGEVVFHRTTEQDGASQMEQLWTIDLLAGRTVKFEPGARHVMLNDLTGPLVAGSIVPITLQFQHAGAITLQVEIVPAAAAGPAASGS
jgi:copper(I)-binding protein